MPNFQILLLDLQNVIDQESSKTSVDDHRVYTYLDPLLDEIKSGEDASNDLEEIIDTLLAVSNLSRWHITQAAVFGLCHLVSYNISSAVIDKIADFCFALLPDSKRELRECSGQLLGAIVAAHPQHLPLLLPTLKSHLQTTSQWEPCEGTCIATGFCLRSLPPNPIDSVLKAGQILLESLCICCTSHEADSYSCYVRLQSLRALSRIGMSPFREYCPEECRSAAMTALGDVDLNVRRMAARAVSSLGPADEESEGFLLTLSELLSTSTIWQTCHGAAEAIKIYAHQYAPFFKPSTVRSVVGVLSSKAVCGTEAMPPHSPEVLEKLVMNTTCLDGIIMVIKSQSEFSEGGSDDCVAVKAKNQKDHVADDVILPGAHWVSDLFHSQAKSLLVRFMDSPFPLLNDCACRNLDFLVENELSNKEAINLMPGLYKLTHHAAMPIRDMALRTLNKVFARLNLENLCNIFDLEEDRLVEIDDLNSLLVGKICIAILKDLVQLANSESFQKNAELKECCLKAFADILPKPVTRAIIQSATNQSFASSIAPILMECVNDRHDYVKVAAFRALASFVVSQGATLNVDGLEFVGNLAINAINDDFDDLLIAIADLMEAVTRSLRLVERGSYNPVSNLEISFLSSLLITPGCVFSSVESVKARFQSILGLLFGDYPLSLDHCSVLTQLFSSNLVSAAQKEKDSHVMQNIAYSIRFVLNSLDFVDKTDETKLSLVTSNLLVCGSILSLSRHVLVSSTGQLVFFKLLQITKDPNVFSSAIPSLLVSFSDIFAKFSIPICNELLSENRSKMLTCLSLNPEDLLVTFDEVVESLSGIEQASPQVSKAKEMSLLPAIFVGQSINSDLIDLLTSFVSSNPDDGSLCIPPSSIAKAIDVLKNTLAIQKSILTKFNKPETIEIRSFEDFPEPIEVPNLCDLDVDETTSSLFLITGDFIEPFTTNQLLNTLLTPSVSFPRNVVDCSFGLINSSIDAIIPLLAETTISPSAAFPLSLLALGVESLSSEDVLELKTKLISIFVHIEDDFEVLKSGSSVLNALLMILLECVRKKSDVTDEFIALFKRKMWRRLAEGSTAMIFFKILSIFVANNDISRNLELSIKQMLMTFYNDDEVDCARKMTIFLEFQLSIGSSIGFELPAFEDAFLANVQDNENFVQTE
ncbi:hypothetical protein P9112_002415 [Eukaryota sp. TZLM1-RC]